MPDPSFDRKAQVARLHAAGMSGRAIAAETGLHQTQVVRMLKKMEGEAREKRVPETRPDHIVNYKRARRGFHVPAHLENQYYGLLKSGVSIDEARRRLNIGTDHSI